MTRRCRQGKRGHGFSLTKPGTHLKNAIAIKTFSKWKNSRLGFIQVDLVAHCGDRVEGFYLNTLSAVGVATGWFEPIAVWGKGQKRVGGGYPSVAATATHDFAGTGFRQWDRVY